jgi:hypothetical protein
MTTTDSSLQVAFGIRVYYLNLLDNQPKSRDIMAMERNLPELSRRELCCESFLVNLF